MQHRRVGWLGVALAATSLLSALLAAAAERPTPIMWDLGDLYSSPQAWESAFARTQDAITRFAHDQGTLGRSADTLTGVLASLSDINREVNRLQVYAGLMADEDLRAASNRERNQRAVALGAAVGQNSAWVGPELLALGAERISALRAANVTLNSRFGFFLDNTLRAGPHTLSTEGESVLADAGELLHQPDALHSQLADADLPFPEFTQATGEHVRLDKSHYDKLRQSQDRGERKRVFDTFWNTYKRYEGTFGTLLSTQVMGDIFSAKARHFSGSLQAAIFNDNMPEAVYRTLITETHAGLPTLHRYLRLRKRLLNITDTLQYYDSYPAILPLKRARNFGVVESEQIVLRALQPLGDDYTVALRRAFAGHWMNVYPAPGKKSGAYMNGSAYDVHPYLLLNHNDDYESLSAFAHEWGHAMHSVLSNQAQPFEKSTYSTFVAETASIGNEMLLNDYMVAHAESKQERLYYLGLGAERIRSSFFRQAMFAEFELALHEELEQGRALSGERMSTLYCALLRQYAGEAEGVMRIDPAYCIEWASVPHFYYNFYVYQYATSMAGAAFLTDAVLKEGEPARARYLALLRAGGSAYPYDLYLRAGIDMATAAPYRALIARLDRILDEIEALLRPT